MTGNKIHFSLISTLFMGLLFLTGCKSAPPEEGSRKEYEYVPPVMISAPPVLIESPKADSDEDLSADEDVDVSEEDEESGEQKKGFFARLFSKDSDHDEDMPTVIRVGDNQVVELDEDGNPIESGKPLEHVYHLQVGDALFVTLSGSGGLNEQIETLVDNEGKIKLRFIGSVKAVGLSATELEREIKAEYTERQKIYKDLTVRVVVPNNFYFIGGEVRQAGRFPLVGRVTLSQAIVAAGNFTEWASNEVVLVRNNEKVIINYKRIRKNPNLDFELLTGDTITVGRSTF
ncbi:polysaccharide biosynthesis/export family protein [Kiritimatiellota bacterium B12222]|nr:polysaccharide biosynthesis/export family protein [Kiritimatiellota bacterium B12222]